MWDSFDSGAFITVEGHEFATYVYSPTSVNGATCSKIGQLVIDENGDMNPGVCVTGISHGASPITCYNGKVTCQLQNGKLGVVRLETHTHVNSTSAKYSSSAYNEKRFNQLLALVRLKDAWDVAVKLRNRRYWL